MGGFKVIINNEVLDIIGQLIIGLYVVGNDVVGLIGDMYGFNMFGICVGYVFYFGCNFGWYVV